MSATIPLTYIEIVIWLMFVFVPSNQWISLTGSIYGYIISLISFAGERFVFVDNLGNISVSYVNTGVEPYLSLITIGMNLIISFTIVTNIRASRKPK